MIKNKNLTPFKLCVLQNFPYIEADFDALTNYGLMCKIVEYLNKTIEQQNITGENVNNLINWFNNLDVQDEINNKLDAMVEDGTLARIINQELLTEITNDIKELKNYDKENQLRNPVLEYMHTIRFSGSSIQGICADDTYYYVYDYSNRKIFKRSLASNELIDEINVDFKHGNGLTILNNVIYSADFETRNIIYYNLTTNQAGYISPFETAEIINLGLTKCIGITKYNDKLLVSLGGNVDNTTKITSLKYYLVDISTNTYEEISLLNTNNINLNGQSVIQDFEYLDGKLYFLNSQPTQIITCNETTNGFIIDNVFTYPTYDVLGVAYGEAEGITILPSNYNGDKTLMIMSQVNRWTPSSAKTCKFYCFNLYHQLPETRYGSFYENGGNKQLVQLDANANNYFENGKGSYPFKDLLSALEFLNNYNGGGQNIQIHAGHYYIQECRNFKGLLIPIENGVEITGLGSFINCDITIGNSNYKSTLNFSNLTFSFAKVTILNADLISTNTGVRTIQEGSDVRLFDVDFTTNSMTAIYKSKVTLKLTTATRLPSGGAIYSGERGSQVFLCNNVIPNANIYNDGTSLICSPGRVNQ